jgi:hypothetical protein
MESEKKVCQYNKCNCNGKKFKTIKTVLGTRTYHEKCYKKMIELYELKQYGEIMNKLCETKVPIKF